MSFKQVKVTYGIDVAPNPRYCGYCIYKGPCCELFNIKLKIKDKDCILRCPSCIQNEIK